MNVINQHQKEETETGETEIQTKESMKKDHFTIKLVLGNPASTQRFENYTLEVKTNRKETQTKRNVSLTPEVTID